MPIMGEILFPGASNLRTDEFRTKWDLSTGCESWGNLGIDAGVHGVSPIVWAMLPG
jgi:hypothetical protein